MARSPLTLAASVTSALPRVAVTGVAALTEGISGRYDSAVATLEDGRRVVVRIPVDRDADQDLRAEAHALTSLTAGIRGVLPFGAPDVLGETTVDGLLAIVQTLLPGYRVDASHVPAGPGVATALAAATARVHELPVHVVRDAGLPVQNAKQVRAEVERLLDRAEATGHLPFGLLRRWSSALGDESLWRFETTVILGGVDPGAFVLQDDADGMPEVTGLLSWGGLSVGDPAVDMRWTASSPAARDEVLTAYAQRSHRAPDPMLVARSRLHAELEFAKWLIHGHTSGDEAIVADAVSLLGSLDESVRDEPLARETISVDETIAAIGRVAAGTEVGDTSMQTDAFNADMLAAFTAEELAAAGLETQPVEMSDWSGLDTAERPDTSDIPTEAVEPLTDDARAAQHARPTTGPAAAESGKIPPTPAPRTPTGPVQRPAEPTETETGPVPDQADTDELDTAARNALRRWTDTV